MKKEIVLPKGHRIVVTHFRKYHGLRGYWIKEEVGYYSPKPTEGFTEALILDKKNRIVAEGQALCGKRDNFCKKIGRDIAVGRAYKAFTENNKKS